MNIITNQIQAYNDKNIKKFMSCYNDEIKVYMLDSGKILTDGKEQLKETMQHAFVNNPNSKTEIITQIIQGDLVVNQEWISDHLPGKIVKSISIYQVRNEKISKLWFGGRTVE